jgi:hypothetical protein
LIKKYFLEKLLMLGTATLSFCQIEQISCFLLIQNKTPTLDKYEWDIQWKNWTLNDCWMFFNWLSHTGSKLICIHAAKRSRFTFCFRLQILNRFSNIITQQRIAREEKFKRIHQNFFQLFWLFFIIWIK